MNTKILFITLLVICFASCIPSLHPIFTEKNRIIDDRIIGEWISDSSFNPGFDFNLKIDSDDDNEQINQTKLSEELKNSILKNEGEVKYRFERSTTITYTKGGVNGKNYSKIKLPLQRSSTPKKSLLENGYEINETSQDPYYILTYAEVDEGNLVEDVMLVNLTEINGNIYMDIFPHENFKKPSRFETNFIPAHTFAKVEFKDGSLVIKQFNSEYIEKLIKEKKVRLKHETLNEQIVLTASTEDLRSFIEKYGNDEKLYEDSELLTNAD